MLHQSLNRKSREYLNAVLRVSLLALVQHLLDHLQRLDLELEVLDHALFHHNLSIEHAL